MECCGDHAILTVLPWIVVVVTLFLHVILTYRFILQRSVVVNLLCLLFYPSVECCCIVPYIYNDASKYSSSIGAHASALVTCDMPRVLSSSMHSHHWWVQRQRLLRVHDSLHIYPCVTHLTYPGRSGQRLLLSRLKDVSF